MTALFIISGIILFVALILALRAAVIIKTDSGTLSVFARIGPVKIRLIPSKEKKINIRKQAKKLRGKKLSGMYEKSGKAAEKKSKKKSSSSKLKELLLNGEDNKDAKGLVSFIFRFLKTAALEFDKKLHITILRMNIGVDGGDAHSTAILCADLSQSAAYLLEILDRHAVLKIKGERTVRVYPVSNSGVFKCDVFVKIHLSIGSILKSAVKLIRNAFKDINSEKQISISANRKETTK